MDAAITWGYSANLMRHNLLMLGCFLALTAFAANAEEPKAVVIDGPTPIEVTATPYTLKKQDGTTLMPGDAVGELSFSGAVRLASVTYRFGGFSGLAQGDGALYAVTDEGHVLKAKLVRGEDGKISGLKDAVMAPLWPDNRPAENKSEYDAEALTWMHKGDEFMVAFEQTHRLVHYNIDLAKKPFIYRTRNAPDDVATLLPANSGIEAMVQLDKDRFFVLSEGSRDPVGNLRGYIVNTDNKWELLNLKATEEFLPTDMAMLPSGDVVLLERSYRVLSGVKMRLSLIKKSDIAPGAIITTQELARMDGGMGIDNMEGITVERGKGGTSLLLISDDNFNPLQNTILVEFALPKSIAGEPEKKAAPAKKKAKKAKKAAPKKKP